MKKNRARDWWKPALCGVSMLLGAALPVQAEQLYVAKLDQVSVALYSEPCATEGATNLKRRATWTEDGKTIEGCWGVVPQFGLILLYWADKTVVGLPAPFFEKVSGT